MEVKNNKNLDKLKDILGFIEKNYQHSISIEDISSFCNFSPSHFMKFFKKSMGTSFIDYLNDYRLSASARMLLSSDDNIIDIAAACGYDNLSYYNRIFKENITLLQADTVIQVLFSHPLFYLTGNAKKCKTYYIHAYNTCARRCSVCKRYGYANHKTYNCHNYRAHYNAFVGIAHPH